MHSPLFNTSEVRSSVKAYTGGPELLGRRELDGEIGPYGQHSKSVS
jgi:hypothetical protein